MVLSVIFLMAWFVSWATLALGIIVLVLRAKPEAQSAFSNSQVSAKSP